MTKVVVFTPTYRPGGLDVLEASLKRQTYTDFYLVVADSLFEWRKNTWKDLQERLGVPTIVGSGRPLVEGNKRNLCASYNDAAELAIDIDADLFISLQDYIWIPEDGIDRFVEVHRRFPLDLITGLTSISNDPPRPEYLLEGSQYTIFDRPYTERPKDIGWIDVRYSQMYQLEPGAICATVHPEHWEANWAAVPVNVFRQGFRWNEDFDKGIAYENMDFAMAVTTTSTSTVVMDTRNHAISLPHKDYFDGEREEIAEFSNRNRYESLWEENAN